MFKVADCKAMHYQLQGDVDPGHLQDLVVVDIDTDQPLDQLLGPNRVVAAYLSIGEAEDYRSYWADMDKDLIIGENPHWKGNYPVRFWKEGWQSLMVARAQEAQAKGFNALYLDKADVYQDIAESYPDDDDAGRRGQMADFIALLCEAVPGMEVILQNAQELLTSPRVHDLIDGCGAEDLVYGEEETGKRNKMLSTNWRVDAYRTAGLPVFVIEYLEKDAIDQHSTAWRTLRPHGFALTIEAEDRALDGHTVTYYSRT